MPFEPDPKLQEAAAQDAENAVKFALENFKVHLDWSDDSISKIEEILDSFHQQVIKDKPTEMQIFNFVRPFGSYLGEVYRRNHGATWGMCSMGEESFPGLCTTYDRQFWPWIKVQKRIENGYEDNIWHYYQVLRESNR